MLGIAWFLKEIALPIIPLPLRDVNGVPRDSVLAGLRKRPPLAGQETYPTTAGPSWETRPPRFVLSRSLGLVHDQDHYASTIDCLEETKDVRVRFDLVH